MTPDCDAPDLEAFRGAAEIGDQPARHGRCDRKRGLTFFGVESAEFGAGRRRRDGAAHGGRVPAFLMQRYGLAHQKFGPDLVARHIGGEELRAAGADDFALGDDGGHEHSARMSVERDVVIVQHVSRGAVDERRILDVSLLQRRNERGEGRGVRPGHFPVKQGDDRIARAGDHHAEAISDAGLGDGLSVGRNILQGQAEYETSEFGSESGHFIDSLRPGRNAITRGRAGSP
jgi:hypothetical protein